MSWMDLLMIRTETASLRQAGDNGQPLNLHRFIRSASGVAPAATAEFYAAGCPDWAILPVFPALIGKNELSKLNFERDT